MNTLIADVGGNLSEDYPTIPGREYSLYFAKHPTNAEVTEPAAGMIRAYHVAGPDATLHPILDSAGEKVEADLSAVEGIAVNFVAHASSVRVTGAGLTEDDGMALSLLPVRS